MVLTLVILAIVSAALAGVIVLRVFKDSGKEEKLDKFAAVVKVGIDGAILALADKKLTVDEAIDLIKKIIEEAKEQFK
ncbi:hypothetical protein LCGC14_1331640 [marine sediment metagenome]|uniref:Uncharacterized protein n=1 Tax=marine sediment metagenome TaxID=412755 RepID=A0A0F9KH69_9ZZZZ